MRVSGEKDGLLLQGAWQNWLSIRKKVKSYPYLTPYTTKSVPGELKT